MIEWGSCTHQGADYLVMWQWDRHGAIHHVFKEAAVDWVGVDVWIAIISQIAVYVSKIVYVSIEVR